MAQLTEMFDLSKIMKDFDPAKLTAEFSKMLQAYKLPGVDVDALVASQKKNMEALTGANRTAFEALQAVAKRQAEIIQETINETTRALDALTKAGSPPEVAAKQVEMIKTAFEKNVANARELTEMITKAQEEAVGKINTRITDSLDEIRDMTLKLKSGGAA